MHSVDDTQELKIITSRENRRAERRTEIDFPQQKQSDQKNMDGFRNKTRTHCNIRMTAVERLRCAFFILFSN